MMLWTMRAYIQLLGPLSLKRIILALAFGLLATYLIAWMCAAWSPVKYTSNPMSSPSLATTSDDLDGQIGMHYCESGWGWFFTTWEGTKNEKTGDIFWRSPYGGTYHRLYGWPFLALWSRVEVLDSQSANRTFEGEELGHPFVIQRQKWQLPWREIFNRGLATKDLPTWFHAQPNQRLALVPLPLPLAGNTIFYAVLYLLFSHLFHRLWRRRQAEPPGFPVKLRNQAVESNLQ